MTTNIFMNDLEEMKFIFNGVERWKEIDLFLYFYSDANTEPSETGYALFDAAVERSMHTVSDDEEELEYHYMTTYNNYANGRDFYLTREAVYAVVLEINPCNQTIVDAKNAIVDKAFN